MVGHTSLVGLTSLGAKLLAAVFYLTCVYQWALTGVITGSSGTLKTRGRVSAPWYPVV